MLAEEMERHEGSQVISSWEKTGRVEVEFGER
jgi:hypothetical protein